MIAVVLLAASAGAAAKGGGQVNALVAQQCVQQKAQLGKKAFRKKYGAKHTMRTCASRIKPQVAAAVGTATGECEQELAETGAQDFVELYGWDESDTVESAMDECIAEGVDLALNPDDYSDDEVDDE
jgi:hypothetical protein